MSYEQLTVRMATASWKNTVGRADKAFSTLPEEQLLREVAPGKNRIIYLLGHLTAINDGMHTILGIGERLHPELDSIFISEPDRSTEDLPSIPDLMKHWEDEIQAKAKAVQLGKAVSFYSCDITRSDEKLVAVVTSSIMTLRGQDSKGR